MADKPALAKTVRRFRKAYANHRELEGHGAGGEVELLSLPYLREGPTSRQWSVRLRTFDAFMQMVEGQGSLRVLDLGAGNGWLCYRFAQGGHHPVAVDLRDDRVDGLRAADQYANHLVTMFARIVASFERLPVSSNTFDLAVFNASLHYSLDLVAALSEAVRVVRQGGHIAILDSPFYRDDAHGQAMVVEKKQKASQTFGARAMDLTALPFVEYLTVQRLSDATHEFGLAWRRHRVRYPWWYELRPIMARLRGARPASRFDFWVASVP